MKHPSIRCYLTLALLLASIGISHADFDAGWAAYDRGDYATALREYRPLAEQGNAETQFNLGWMYSNGKGIPKDNIRAYMWTNLAASNGAGGYKSEGHNRQKNDHRRYRKSTESCHRLRSKKLSRLLKG